MTSTNDYLFDESGLDLSFIGELTLRSNIATAGNKVIHRFWTELFHLLQFQPGEPRIYFWLQLFLESLGKLVNLLENSFHGLWNNHSDSALPKVEQRSQFSAGLGRCQTIQSDCKSLGRRYGFARMGFLAIKIV